MKPGLLKNLVAKAAAPYRPAGPWAYNFARGKLAGDPLFAALLAPDLLPREGRYLDLGCGQGLLAAWLLAAARCHGRGEWPADVAPPPRIAAYHGVELLASAVRRARAALADSPIPVTVEAGDMCTAPLPTAEVITLFDVLHYVPAASQEALLRRIHAALPAKGLLLLRVGDASAGLPYRLSRWTDSLVVFAHCGRWPRLHGRTLDTWQTLLADIGFRTETRPMGGTGFANTLILARPAPSP